MCTICTLSIAFNVQHPRALSVAVATRAGIDAGELDRRVPALSGGLPHDERAEAIAALQGLQRRIENVLTPAELLALPDFFVLMIETRTWGFFHPTENGFSTDSSPEPPRAQADANGERDTIVLVSETAMRRFLAHRLSFREAVERGWVVVDGEPLPSRTTHEALDRVYPLVGLSQFACA